MKYKIQYININFRRIIIYQFMEYQKKKKQILADVQYTNLLSFALVQNKLQKNFKSIVQALLLTQTAGTDTKNDLKELTNSTMSQFKAINSKLSELEKKMNQKDNSTRKQENKPSMKIMHDQEENNLDKNSMRGISTPKVNINIVQSLSNTNQEIPENSSPNSSRWQQQCLAFQNNQNKTNQQLWRNHEDLKNNIDKILSQYMNPTDLDKTLQSIKKNINNLKGQVKIIADRADRDSKSIKRLSLGMGQNIPTVLVPAPNSSYGQQGQKNSQSALALNDFRDQFQKQLNNLHIQINSMKLCLEQLKESTNQTKRKENKTHLQVDQILKSLKKNQEKNKNDNQSFEQQLKELKMEVLNLQTKPQSQGQVKDLKKSRKIIQTKQNISPNANNQINDRISKLQAAIQGLVTQAQFKRFKAQTKDKIASLEGEDENIRKQLKQQIQMLTQILDGKQVQLSAMNTQIQEIKNKIMDMPSSCQRKYNISISKCQQLKKGLQNLRQDLEFYKSMNQNSCSQNKLIHQSPDESNINVDKTKPDESNKSTQDLKKYLNRKLHDQRTYLLGLIRDLQKKSGGKSNFEQDLVNVWDKLSQINLFLNKKANEDDIKKSLSYYQKKLASLYQRLNSNDENNQDARVARTNWFCLSCDKSLQNYKGKVGQHVVWDSMPVKAGYTKYYNKDQKKGLPTLKR